ncbi:MAG: Crp/Fnr family transcriptional regulator [Velocimicrobium sp.]
MINYIPLLKTVPLFFDIEANDLSELLNCLSAKIKTFQTQESIFSEGDSAEFVGIILSGEAQIVMDDYYGNRNIVASLTVGHLFGEAFACADVSILPVSVIATNETIIMQINYKKIITTCSNCCTFHNKLIYNMLRIVANKNVMLNQKIDVISKRTTREKILSYLAIQAKQAGQNSFSIPFNRQELADYLFVDRSALSNELSKLSDKGVLHFHKNTFELL